MLTVKDIPTYLEQYTDFERIYKRRYELRHQPAALAAYLRTLPLAYLKENEILLPEKLIPRFRQENGTIYQNEPLTFFRHAPMLFKIEKHPRYLAKFWHNHSLFEILYIYRGSCQNEFPDQRFILHENEVCLIAPRINHRVGVFDDSLLINIQVSPKLFASVFSPYLKSHGELSKFFLRALRNDSYHPYLLYTELQSNTALLRSCIEAAFVEQINQQVYAEDALCSYGGLFLTSLQRADKKIFLAEMTRNNEKKFGAIAERIQRDFRHLTLQKLAAEFHYSVPYLSRLIKKNTGATFVSVIQSLRLQYAADQLESTDYSVADIAEDAGYEGSEHFIRIFRQHFGTTPLKYRKQHSAVRHQ